MEQCKYYKKCGGCQLQNLSYIDQLKFKQKTVKKFLGEYCKPYRIIGMDTPYHYRNKVQAAFATDRNGKIISGVYQSGSHRIVSVDSCQTEDKKADEIIVSIRKLLKNFKIPTYNEHTGSGVLRHVLVKRGFTSGEILVVLVTATPVLNAKNNFVKALLQKHPEITTIVQNINKFDTNLVLGEREIVLYGKGYIEDILCGCKFRISSRSFYQINPVQTEILYSTAIEYAGLTGKETVIDAYCGIGTIGIIAAKKAKSVIGTELNSEAFRNAIVNARINDAKNIYFYNADAGELMEQLAADNKKIDVVMMDPPRAGSTVKFLASTVKLNPKRIVYVSCNPETQARDLKYLTAHGYTVQKIQPVDMFPHTAHVETVCLLINQNASAKHHVNVGIDAEDYYRIKEGK